MRAFESRIAGVAAATNVSPDNIMAVLRAGDGLDDIVTGPRAPPPQQLLARGLRVATSALAHRALCAQRRPWPCNVKDLADTAPRCAAQVSAAECMEVPTAHCASCLVACSFLSNCIEHGVKS